MYLRSRKSVVVLSAALLVASAGSLTALSAPAPSAGHRSAAATRTSPGSAPDAVPSAVAAVATPSCGPSDLSIGAPTIQLATATALVSAVASNVSSTACTLDGGAVAGIVAQMLDLAGQVPSGSSVGGLAPQQLPPGSSLPVQFSLPIPTGSGGTCTVSVAPTSALGPLTVALPVPCVVPPSGGAAPIPALQVPVVPAPSLTGVPSVPSVPSVAALPSLPTSGSGLPLPGLPSVPGVPSVPSPSLPGLPSVPGIPSVPSPGGGGLPSLPALSSLLPGAPAPASPLPTQPAAPAAPPAKYASGYTGYDISWPQCGGAYPPQDNIGVVGVNDGRGFTTNPCFASEAAWAEGALDTYINVNSPPAHDSTDSSGPGGNCTASNTSCLAYNYGYNDAQNAMSFVRSQGRYPRMWWLDVETVGGCAQSFPTGGSGYWSCNQGLNNLTIQGALDAIRGAGGQVGIYSTSYQWGVITNGYDPSGGAPPNWLAGDEASPPSAWCNGSNDFANGPPWLLQIWPSQTYDRDEAC